MSAGEPTVTPAQVADVISLDSKLSKPQLLRVIDRSADQLLGMHEIAKALSVSDIEFAQETFQVFADQLDTLAYNLNKALGGDQDWFDEEFGRRRRQG